MYTEIVLEKSLHKWATGRWRQRWKDNVGYITGELNSFHCLFVVTGTKWCGNSDIAKSYFDLGREKDVDKCCRTHDLCPVKVRSYRTRYNLTNEHFYTK
jgi:hypothetical protein